MTVSPRGFHVYAAARADSALATFSREVGQSILGCHVVDLGETADDVDFGNHWPGANVVGRHVFYFGNAIGESGNSTRDAKVNAYDILIARDNQTRFVNALPQPYALAVINSRAAEERGTFPPGEAVYA